jgi:hypothetical protein
MAPLLPRRLLRGRKTEAAAIVALVAIHAGLLIVVVFWGEESAELFDTLTNPFLFCQFGLLAWWACLKGPRLFWRVILSVVLAASLIALASREYVLEEARPNQGWSWLFWDAKPWDDWGWAFYFISTGGLLMVTAPFILVAFVILGWIVPCGMTHQRRRSDATASGPPAHALSDWQFGVGDMLAGTAAIAALTGFIVWTQPYPTWILDCAKNAVVIPRTYGWGVPCMFIPSIITVILATWFTGYFLLGRTVHRRHLVILAMLALADGVLSLLTTYSINHLAFPEENVPLAPSDAVEWIGTVLLHWLILASSFFLLRIAGFRITRARSRVLRRWSTSG